MQGLVVNSREDYAEGVCVCVGRCLCMCGVVWCDVGGTLFIQTVEALITR